MFAGRTAFLDSSSGSGGNQTNASEDDHGSEGEELHDDCERVMGREGRVSKDSGYKRMW